MVFSIIRSKGQIGYRILNTIIQKELNLFPFLLRSNSIRQSHFKNFSFYNMDLIGAVDQGTSSTRFLLFNYANGNIIASHQIEIKQYFPKSGWVEIDANEIFDTVCECIQRVCKKNRR